MERYSVKATATYPANLAGDGEPIYTAEAVYEDFNVLAPSLEVATQMAALRVFQEWERLRITRGLPRGGLWLNIVIETTEGRTT